MARIDKYDPISGGCRGTLSFAIDATDVGDVIGVGLNASGRLVRGAGQTGIIGVIIPTQIASVGTRIDVMRSGEAVDFKLSDGTTAAVAGTSYFVDGVSGAVATPVPAAAGSVGIGYTVEADRLVVHVGR